MPDPTWQLVPEALLPLRRAHASRALRRDQVHLALLEADEILETSPDDPDALRIAAEAALRMGDAAVARLALEHFQRFHVPEAADLARLARACFELAAFDDAMRHVERALDLDPGLADAWAIRARLLERAGQRGAAAVAWHQAHVLAPVEHPLPPNPTGSDWEDALAVGFRGLPGPIRGFYVGVRLRWEDWPADEDLLSRDPPLSPSVEALHVGEPPVDGDPWVERPEAVRLFRGNLLPGCRDLDDLAARIGQALLREAAAWLDLGDAVLDLPG